MAEAFRGFACDRHDRQFAQQGVDRRAHMGAVALQAVGDLIDVHAYPGPAAPPNQPDRAAVLGEFGGLGLPVRGHTWQEEKNWGYRSYTTPEELTAAYLDRVERAREQPAAAADDVAHSQLSLAIEAAD